MDKLYGIYVGMVVQNNDPEKRGRIKIFIPRISANIYDGWNSSEVDQSFKTPSDIAEILPRLKAVLPWSEAAMPILSTGTSYLYDPRTNSSITEKNDYISTGSKYDEWNNDYSETSFDETTNGTYTIPDVGSKVYVFFKEGNVSYPVYFSQCFDGNDWSGVFESDQYPNGYSNNIKKYEDYQQKLIIKRRGGLFEIVDSVKKEKIRIQHKNGTYLTFSDSGCNIFTPENYNILVYKDFYSTIRGNSNSRIYKDKLEQINYNSDVVVGTTLDESDSYQIIESGLSIPTSVLLDTLSNTLSEKYSLLQLISLSSSVGKKVETNKFSWDVTVGSGGISFSSLGKFTLDSPYQLYTSKYIEMIANNGLKVTSNEYTHIISPINIIQGRQFVTESLDVGRNLKVGGSIAIAGETYLQHVTAPLSWQKTEKSTIKANPGKWRIYGATLTTPVGPVSPVSIEGGILEISEEHNHWFANLPLSLLNTNLEVYLQENLIQNVLIPSKSIINGASTSQNKSSDWNGPG